MSAKTEEEVVAAVNANGDAERGDAGSGAGAVHPDPTSFVVLTSDKLDLAACVASVASPRAGATSTFIGTTRDHFDGRSVVRLEYQAYEAMAVKELHRIIAECRSKHDVLGVAVHHRLGVVPVLEASVLIAVSSEHRASGLDAVRFLIDTLKVGVPIWKKEVYGDDVGEAAVWKENSEAAKPAAASAPAEDAGTSTDANDS